MPLPKHQLFLLLFKFVLTIIAKDLTIFFKIFSLTIIANVKGLAMFTMKNVERERKLRFLFDIYDIDGDGLICNSELYKVR